MLNVVGTQARLRVMWWGGATSIPGLQIFRVSEKLNAVWTQEIFDGEGENDAFKKVFFIFHFRILHLFRSIIQCVCWY